MLVPLMLLALTLTGADAGAPSPEPDARPTRPVTPAASDVSALPFTSDSIAQVVRAHQPEIQDCYERMLAERQQKVQGRLLTSFVITPAGTVNKARVEKQGTTLKDKDLHACVVEVLAKLRFPKPADGKNHPVEYPFNLKAVE